MKKLNSKEGATQREILEWLSLNPSLGFYWRNNQNTARHGLKLRGAGRIDGTPDIIGCYNGKFIGIEVKSTGCKQKPSQKEFQKNIEKHGGLYILAFTLDDVIKGLK